MKGSLLVRLGTPLILTITLSIGLTGCVWQGGGTRLNSSKTESQELVSGATASAKTSADIERHKTEVAEAQEVIQAMEKGYYQEAVSGADKLIAQYPNNSEVYSIKGLCSALLGDIRTGHAMTDKAYELDPYNSSNFYNIAMVYKLEGNIEKAQEWFEKVLVQEPDNTWSLYGLATIYADRGQDELALQWLERAVKTDSSVKAVAREQDHFERFHGNRQFESLTR